MLVKNTYIHTHTHIHTYIRSYTHTHTYGCMYLHTNTYIRIYAHTYIQGGSNMTGTDLCVNKPHLSPSYLNHLLHTYVHTYIRTHAHTQTVYQFKAAFIQLLGCPLTTTGSAILCTAGVIWWN